MSYTIGNIVYGFPLFKDELRDCLSDEEIQELMAVIETESGHIEDSILLSMYGDDDIKALGVVISEFDALGATELSQLQDLSFVPPSTRPLFDERLAALLNDQPDIQEIIGKLMNTQTIRPFILWSYS